MSLWLTFDIGTTGTKAALLRESGELVASATHGYETASAPGGVMEQHPEDWWRAVTACANDLRSHTGQIDGVVLTGQMQNLIAVDARGSAVRPALLYADTRARDAAAFVNTTLGADRLRSVTGNPQDADGLLAKLVWLARHEPRTLDQAAHLLFGAADFIAYRLTGSAVTDTTTASTTGLMDLVDRTWLSANAFETLGIGTVVPRLPALIAGGAQVGTVTADVAQALGVAANLPVYLSAGDAGAQTLGAGAGTGGRVYAYVGTSGWIAFSAGEPASLDGVLTLAHPHPQGYIQVAPLLTAGGNLDWVRELFQHDSHEALIAAAAAQPPSPVIFLPYLNGERTPFRDPLARGAFIGLSSTTRRADLYRAVLEGVAFAYRHALDALTGGQADSLTFTGGGSRSHVWAQLFADVLNVQVAVAAEAELVGLRGALLSALVTRGERFGYDPVGLRFEATLTPDSRLRAHYDRRYTVFRSLYPALRESFAQLQA